MKSFVAVLVAATIACVTSTPDPATHQPAAPANLPASSSFDTSPPVPRIESTTSVGAGAVAPRDTLGGSHLPEDWLDLLAEVDTNTTLGGWLARYFADSVGGVLPTGMWPDVFCRSSAAIITAAGRRWRRSAVFVIPPPPAGEALPDSTALAARLCRLRGIWLESVDQDSAAVERAALELRGELSRAFGESRPGVFLAGPGTGTWVGGASWIRGPRVVVLAADPGGVIHSEIEEADSIVQLPTVVALSFVVGNGLDTSVSTLVNQTVFPKVEPYELVRMARADSAIGWSRLRGLERLREVFAHHRDTLGNEPSGRSLRQRDPAADTALVHGLAALRDTSLLPPPERSAALLAADLALDVHAHWLDYKGRDTVLRGQLEQLGAKYDYAHMGAVYLHVRPWLWRAYQLDSLGPAGRSAFAELQRVGWTTTVGCGGAFEKVIEQGERAFQAGLSDPMVHLDVANAYADVFSFAPDGAGQSASDSARSQAERSAAARLRAIGHYRQALDRVRDPGLRRTIWDNAVRLMLGRTIEHQYYCEMYD